MFPRTLGRTAGTDLNDCGTTTKQRGCYFLSTFSYIYIIIISLPWSLSIALLRKQSSNCLWETHRDEVINFSRAACPSSSTANGKFHVSVSIFSVVVGAFIVQSGINENVRARETDIAVSTQLPPHWFIGAFLSSELPSAVIWMLRFIFLPLFNTQINLTSLHVFINIWRKPARDGWFKFKTERNI